MANKTSIPLLVVFLLICMESFAFGDGYRLVGRWWTPLGVVRISQNGNKVIGRISWRCKICPFKRGQEVIKATLLEDSLAGKMRYCLKGKKCKGDGWAPMVMVVAREGRVLSGAAHFKATQCKIGGKGKAEGIVMRKLRRRPKKIAKIPAKVAKDQNPKSNNNPATSAENPRQATQKDQATGMGVVADAGETMEAEVQGPDPRAYEKNVTSWQQAMEKGAEYMHNGFFERARRLFKKATDLNPTRPEAFNGIGVTYYARNDYQEALRWYKKSLEVNPNFGDAYYNMACIYSLLKKPNMAFRYLQIAALNGFVQPKVLSSDPDLKNIRGDDRFKKILQKMRSGQ